MKLSRATVSAGSASSSNLILASSSVSRPSMEYRKLGRTGLDVSVISMGSWVSFDYQIGVPQAKEIMQACYDAGINFVSI